jgi:hypothetical protein
VKNHDFTPKNHIFSNCRGRCIMLLFDLLESMTEGADPGGAPGAHRRAPARAHPKIGKNKIF